MRQPEDYGYTVCSVDQFLRQAPQEYIARFNQDFTEFPGDWILWDPIDKPEGFMLRGESHEKLRADFFESFPDLAT